MKNEKIQNFDYGLKSKIWDFWEMIGMEFLWQLPQLTQNAAIKTSGLDVILSAMFITFDGDY